MTIAAYQTLYESSVAFGMRKALQAEQGKTDMKNQVRIEQPKCSVVINVRDHFSLYGFQNHSHMILKCNCCETIDNQSIGYSIVRISLVRARHSDDHICAGAYLEGPREPPPNRSSPKKFLLCLSSLI